MASAPEGDAESDRALALRECAEEVSHLTPRERAGDRLGDAAVAADALGRDGEGDVERRAHRERLGEGSRRGRLDDTWGDLARLRACASRDDLLAEDPFEPAAHVPTHRLRAPEVGVRRDLLRSAARGVALEDEARPDDARIVDLREARSRRRAADLPERLDDGLLVLVGVEGVERLEEGGLDRGRALELAERPRGGAAGLRIRVSQRLEEERLHRGRHLGLAAAELAHEIAGEARQPPSRRADRLAGGLRHELRHARAVLGIDAQDGLAGVLGELLVVARQEVEQGRDVPHLGRPAAVPQSLRQRAPFRGHVGTLHYTLSRPDVTGGDPRA